MKVSGKHAAWIITLLAAIVVMAAINFIPINGEHSSSLHSSGSNHKDASGDVAFNGQTAPSVVADPQSVKSRDHAPQVVDGSFSVPPGNAIDVLAELEPRAKQGDDSAAFGIYMKLMACRRSMAVKVDEQSQSIYREAGIEESVLSSTESTLDDCSNLTAEDYKQAGHWLETAADRGMLIAQLTYAADPEAVVGNASEMLKSPDAVKRYKTKAMQYLNQAASKGNVDALRRLGNAYRVGVLTDQDLVKSYAYCYAANRAYPGAYSDRFMDKFTQHLNVDQVNEAKRKGMIIYEQCCSP